MQSPRISVTFALIIINLVVFIAGLFAQQPAILNIPNPQGEPTSIFTVMGSYSWYTCFIESEWWRLVTYQYLHANLFHLAFNMWALYFFGPLVEAIFGPRRFLIYYTVCGIAGALFSSLLGMTGILGDTELLSMTALRHWQLIPMVGASASIYGILIATAFLFPHARVSLLFPPVTLTLRTLACIIIGIACFTIISYGPNAGGEAGHLGGIIAGALIMLVLKRRLPFMRPW